MRVDACVHAGVKRKHTVVVDDPQDGVARGGGPPPSLITKARSPRSPGTRRVAASTACRAGAASTSPTMLSPRHAAGPRRDWVAMRWLRRDDSTTEATYGQLAARSSQVAKRTRIARHRPRGSCLHTDGEDSGAVRHPQARLRSVTAGLRTRASSHRCSPRSAPTRIRERISRGDGKVLVTTPALYRRQVAEIRSALPSLEHVVIVDAAREAVTGTIDFGELVEA